jgi:hypothetical protein
MKVQREFIDSTIPAGEMMIDDGACCVPLSTRKPQRRRCLDKNLFDLGKSSFVVDLVF